VREIADETALAMALIENIQRENVNPLEEAQGIKRLIDEFSMTHEKAADAVGRSRVSVSNLLRLLTLCEPVQEMLMQGKLDMGHARALIGLSGAQQVMLAEKIALNDCSVRDAEQLVKNHRAQLDKSSENPNKKQQRMKNVDLELLKREDVLSNKLGKLVRIKAGENGSGTLKINYANLEQLDEIIARVSS